MSYDPSFPRRVTEYKFDGENRLLEVRRITEADGSVEFTQVWRPEPVPPSFAFEHDQQGRLVVIIRPDGKTEYF